MLMATLSGNCYLSTPVLSVHRREDGVTVKSKNGEQDYDHIIMACHSDQALRLLADPTTAENDVLGSMKYQSNDVILHTDKSIMPVNKKAWASWNFRLNDLEQQRDQPALITYYMNRLQGLQEDTDYLVSLNSRHLIDPALIIDSYEYHHPVMDDELFHSQKRWAEISANSSTFANTHYCGAYWHNAFHEDGVHSALNVCESFGISL
jgi:predicted NAD/FAD-binding protein